MRPTFPIQTARLNLRPHLVSDLDDLVVFHSDPDVVRFIPWPVRDRVQTAAALEIKLTQSELTEPNQWLVLAVELRDTSVVIGEVLLKWASAEDRQGEIGFAFASQYQGRGFAAESAGEILRMGFEELGLHRIVGVCIEGNVASPRLLKRLGFRHEGRFVDAVFFKGAWANELIFAITEDEWRGSR